LPARHPLICGDAALGGEGIAGFGQIAPRTVVVRPDIGSSCGRRLRRSSSVCPFRRRNALGAGASTPRPAIAAIPKPRLRAEYRFGDVLLVPSFSSAPPRRRDGSFHGYGTVDGNFGPEFVPNLPECGGWLFLRRALSTRLGPWWEFQRR
jgi:hypothetical protein